MAKTELQQIIDYVKELEEELYEWDEGVTSWQIELPKLHRTIARLMEMSAASDDSDFRTVLAAIEYKARNYRDCILMRSGMKN